MDEHGGGPVAGPSRPRRPPADLGDRIIALQRRQASGLAPSHRLREATVDEFDRGQPSRQGSDRVLFDPSRPGLGPPVSLSSDGYRREASDRGSRHGSHGSGYTGHHHHGGHGGGGGDILSPLPSRSPIGAYIAEDRTLSKGKFRAPSSSAASDHRAPSTTSSGRRLFDPSIHDPHAFGNRMQSSSPQPLEGGNSLLRRTGYSRTAEEEADRERERRRRKEGSERGSLAGYPNGAGAGSGSGSGGSAARKKDSDGKSRGSRSSEGSESFKDRERGKGKGDTGVKAILKDIHDQIKNLETELTEVHRLMSADPEAGISVLLDQPRDPYSRDIRKKRDDSALWMDLIQKHKELADLHHNFLVRVFDPLVPSSLHQLTIRYNIPSRLWQTAYHLILERLRFAWVAGHPNALDLLTDLVYDAYKFYTDLLEDLSLTQFRAAWIEALGDLARYRMAIASHLAEGRKSPRTPGLNGVGLGRLDEEDPLDGATAPGDGAASIGKAVAESWDVEDKETWRTTARDWYNMGITEKPGEGRLHHHLALLCRDTRGQEGRALHHFSKSMTVTHAYETSRESILPLFDSHLQTQRSLPEAGAMDLFVRLHGMLFTKISLDSFPIVMSRFMERLEEDARLDGASRRATISQVDWIIMASVNLTAIMQYGLAQGLVRKALAQEGVERRRAQVAPTVDEEDEDAQAPAEEDDTTPPQTRPTASADDGLKTIPEDAMPLTLARSLQLAFSILDFAMRHPMRQQGVHQVLNPYITLMLTFIATLARQPHVLAILTPHMPWQSLFDFLNSQSAMEVKEESRLVVGPALPEDWAVRGMEWVGRRVYERGFWKGKSGSGSGSGGGSGGRGSGGIAQPTARIGEKFNSEMDVLLATFDSAIDISEGVVDELGDEESLDGAVAVQARRTKRVAWAAGIMLKYVDGIALRDGKLVVVDPLESKIRAIQEQVLAVEKEEEERRSAKQRRAEAERAAELEQYYATEEGSGEESDPELAALREKRRLLQSLLDGPAPSIPSTVALPRKAKAPRRLHRVVPGYTMLLFDTNVLLSSLAMFASVVESGRWSVIVPLPVVTELDGLSKSAPPLGEAALAAVGYLESHIRKFGLSLKIQTSKGNYLSDLLIRTEDHASANGDEVAKESNTTSKARTMDDLILNIAAFQSENFVDRSLILGGSAGAVPPGSTKVLLVTFDRNMRLLARARGIEAVDEKEITAILAK